MEIKYKNIILTKVEESDINKDGTFTFPEGTNEIGESAFANNKAITELIIPDSVKIIRKWAFENCSNLKKVVIPNSVSYAEDEILLNCFNVKDLTIPSKFRYSAYYMVGTSTLSHLMDNGVHINLNEEKPKDRGGLGD